MSDKTKPILLDVKDMKCEGCVDTISKALKKLDANATIKIDLISGRVEAATTASSPKLVAAIYQAGFDAHVVSE
jgi:copper chaperone